MGHKLFSKAGFEEREMVIIGGYDKHPDPIDIWFGQRPVVKGRTNEL
jgi:hypothetical protein